MRMNMKEVFYQIMTFAIIATFSCGLIYGVGQQVVRQSADDVQAQMAEDAASNLSSGLAPETIIPERIDMAKSLAPFLIVYNKDQKVVASSGTINGQVPSLPSGVLDSAKDGETHITWQPNQDVRDAIVVVSYSGKQSGYVLAGRSLREVEKHESLQLSLFWDGFLA